MEPEYQLINQSDQAVIDRQTLEYSGWAKLLPTWAENDADLFRKAIQDGYADLANQIVENVLSSTGQ